MKTLKVYSHVMLICFNSVVISSMLSSFWFVVLQIQRLSGVDSDFASFVQHAGIPSIDIYYGRGTLPIHMN